MVHEVTSAPSPATTRSGLGEGAWSRPRKGLISRLAPVWPPIALTILALIVWEVLLRLLKMPEYVLPGPLSILAELFKKLPLLAMQTTTTLLEILIGFAAGSLIGLVLAVGMSQWRALERSLYPIIVTLQTVPKMAVAPIFVMWFGFGLMPKVVVVVIMCFFPVTINALYGLTAVDPNLVDLMRSVSASRWQTLTKIQFPNSLPYMFSGLKIGMTMAVIGALVGEWVGSEQGLGFQMLVSTHQLETSLLFATILVMSLIGLILFYLISVAESVLVTWQEPVESTRGQTRAE